MHQTVARNVVQQQGCGNVGAISELSSPPFGADNHFLKKYSIENQYYIFRIGQTSAFTWYILDTSENQWEISEVGRLSCFIEFLHDFTLYVINFFRHHFTTFIFMGLPDYFLSSFWHLVPFTPLTPLITLLILWNMNSINFNDSTVPNCFLQSFHSRESFAYSF